MLKGVPTDCALVAASPALAQEPADDNPLRNAYFGETHLHTAFSLDANISGARLMPADSLSYAKGEPVTLAVMQHKRPLDFAAGRAHVQLPPRPPIRCEN